MNTTNKRASPMNANDSPKRLKKDCSYGEKCYRRNPAHFREFGHPHLEAILDTSTGGNYIVPDHLSLQRFQILEQLEVIVEKQLYVPKNIDDDSVTSTSLQASSELDGGFQSTTKYNDTTSSSTATSKNIPKEIEFNSTSSSNEIKETTSNLSIQKDDAKKSPIEREKRSPVSIENEAKRDVDSSKRNVVSSMSSNVRGPDYVPMVAPTRRAEDYLKVVLPRGKMAEKHARSAPYHIFYTTITDCKETHNQPYSITFLELLDSSLGELKCSLQINFMVDIAWLLAQYYFAGYSQKKLTILYGEDCQDLRGISAKKPHVDAHRVTMATPFGKHHTKMMLLCYEDGSLRVVVSTANLYIDDWENRTQGLWLSPALPELPPDAMPHAGDSPTMFKKSLLKYLHHYHLPNLSYYIERVKRTDFSSINVFLVASVPGGHFDEEWGLTRVGSLLRRHCCLPPGDQRSWPLLAQASSLGSYGKEPKLWLTGDFLHHFTKIKNQPQMLSQPPELQLIYPSLENVRQSHDGLLGGGCLPYAAEAHARQPWLNQFLHQWSASHTHRGRAMPHIKSYARVNRGGSHAAYYLLTSGNVSKAAWGQLNKGNAALRIMSYEAGVLLLPTFLINAELFPLSPGCKDRLIIPYDLPPTRYTGDMSPWVQDYLHT